jgi:predicted DNA-binding transcriptional regulator AlpA
MNESAPSRFPQKPAPGKSFGQADEDLRSAAIPLIARKNVNESRTAIIPCYPVSEHTSRKPACKESVKVQKGRQNRRIGSGTTLHFQISDYKLGMEKKNIPPSSHANDLSIPQETDYALKILLIQIPNLTRDQQKLVVDRVNAVCAEPTLEEADEPLVTAPELEKILGVHRSTLWRWFRKNPDLARRLGEVADLPGRRRFNRAAVMAFKKSLPSSDQSR